MLAAVCNYAIKKTHYPAEQQHAKVQAKRQDYQACLENVDKSRLIFIDESGTHLGMSRLYGRAKGGERVNSFVPFDKGKRITLIAALGADEIKAGLFGHWYTDGKVFLEFINYHLVPTLQAHDIVIMDNLSAHKVLGVRESIEAAGARLLYLPPYSPDLSPIELCWSKIKSHLRKKAASNDAQLKRAICDAFKTVTQNDIENWFAHCGYYIH